MNIALFIFCWLSAIALILISMRAEVHDEEERTTHHEPSRTLPGKTLRH